MAEDSKKIRLHRGSGDDDAVESLERILTDSGYEVEVVDEAAQETAVLEQDCDGLVILVGDEDNTCQEIEPEVLQVLSIDGPVIGVWCPGASGNYLPDLIESMATAVVPLVTPYVIDALKGRIKTFLQPNGTERAKRIIERVKCQQS